jgi:hypothetical protein
LVKLGPSVKNHDPRRLNALLYVLNHLWEDVYLVQVQVSLVNAFGTEEVLILASLDVGVDDQIMFLAFLVVFDLRWHHIFTRSGELVPRLVLPSSPSALGMCAVSPAVFIFVIVPV